jgi:ADP-heptose:LPS heptosyltransferase
MKILVIQQKMIGDVLVSTILCDNLRKKYPNAQIDYMVYQSTVAVLNGNISIDNLILFEEKHRSNKWELFKLLLSIRKEKYDVVIDAYSKLESWLVILFSKAKKKISFKKKGIRFFYSDTIERPRISNTNYGLIIDERLALLEPLQLNITIDPFPKIYVSTEEEIFASRLFKKYEIDRSKKTVMVSIIGSDMNKTYPLKYMSKLVDLIADTGDVNILFNYIPSQIDDAKKVYEGCKTITQNKVYFSVLGKNLREFIAVMNCCDMIIGNDGGAINIAKSLKKPSFIIFSPFIDKKGWATFEDGIQNISIHLSDFKPELFKNKSYKTLVSESKELYREFNLDLIEPKLSIFLENHLN